MNGVIDRTNQLFNKGSWINSYFSVYFYEFVFAVEKNFIEDKLLTSDYFGMGAIFSTPSCVSLQSETAPNQQKTAPQFPRGHTEEETILSEQPCKERNGDKLLGEALEGKTSRELENILGKSLYNLFSRIDAEKKASMSFDEFAVWVHVNSLYYSDQPKKERERLLNNLDAGVLPSLTAYEENSQSTAGFSRNTSLQKEKEISENCCIHDLNCKEEINCYRSNSFSFCSEQSKTSITATTDDSSDVFSERCKKGGETYLKNKRLIEKNDMGKDHQKCYSRNSIENYSLPVIDVRKNKNLSMECSSEIDSESFSFIKTNSKNRTGPSRSCITENTEIDSEFVSSQEANNLKQIQAPPSSITLISVDVNSNVSQSAGEIEEESGQSNVENFSDEISPFVRGSHRRGAARSTGEIDIVDFDEEETEDSSVIGAVNFPSQSDLFTESEFTIDLADINNSSEDNEVDEQKEHPLFIFSPTRMTKQKLKKNQIQNQKQNLIDIDQQFIDCEDKEDSYDFLGNVDIDSPKEIDTKYEEIFENNSENELCQGNWREDFSSSHQRTNIIENLSKQSQEISNEIEEEREISKTYYEIKKKKKSTNIDVDFDEKEEEEKGDQNLRNIIIKKDEQKKDLENDYSITTTSCGKFSPPKRFPHRRNLSIDLDQIYEEENILKSGHHRRNVSIDFEPSKQNQRDVSIDFDSLYAEEEAKLKQEQEERNSKSISPPAITKKNNEKTRGRIHRRNESITLEPFEFRKNSVMSELSACSPGRRDSIISQLSTQVHARNVSVELKINFPLNSMILPGDEDFPLDEYDNIPPIFIKEEESLVVNENELVVVTENCSNYIRPQEIEEMKINFDNDSGEEDEEPIKYFDTLARFKMENIGEEGRNGTACSSISDLSLLSERKTEFGENSLQHINLNQMVPLNSKPNHKRQKSSKTRSNAFVLSSDANKENHNIIPKKYSSNYSSSPTKRENSKKKTITLLTKKRKNREQNKINEKKKMKGKTTKKRSTKRKRKKHRKLTNTRVMMNENRSVKSLLRKFENNMA